jgi:hypothetical protein
LRAEAATFLAGSDRILHGGDIGNVDVLAQLADIAPTIAVRGNNDEGAWAHALPETELFEFGGIYIYAIHDLLKLALDPHAAGVQVVVSGHSHKPKVDEREGVFFINPGSAGPRRFKLPIAIGELVVENGAIFPRIVELKIPGAV